MIYEFRTYTLKPGSTPEVVKRFGDNYEHRKKYSELAAFWYTEIGPLNQIIHVWPYESSAERDRVRAESQKDANWPPPIRDFLVDMTSEIFVPFPGSPTLPPGAHGPIYEMRSYALKPATVPAVIEAFMGAIEGRAKLSSLSCAMYSDAGPLNKFVHVWPYESLEQRHEVRQEAVASGIWPPPAGMENILTQENKIMLPAPFSPMQ